MKKYKLPFTFTDYIPFISQSNRYLKATNIDKSLNYNQFIYNSSIGTSTMIIKDQLSKY